MPPQIGLIFALLFVALSIGLFGATATQATVQAQDDTPVGNALVTANVAEVAIDDLGDLVITIQNSEPTYANRPITFSATLNITDTTGLSFSWQFGDTQSARGRDVQHEYRSTGVFIARLFVSTENEQREITKALNIIPEPTTPEIKPGGVSYLIIGDNPQELEAQKSINFLATVLQGTNVRYIWTIFDRTKQELAGSSITYSFDQPGIYRIRVQAINTLGSASLDFFVNIKDAPPENLTFAYNTETVLVGEAVQFIAHQTRGTNLNYEWKFSDGSQLLSGPQITYIFATPGTYEVYLTAWTSADTQRTEKVEYSETIHVQAAPPDALDIIPGAPINPRERMSVRVTVRSQVPVILQYVWGDGQSTTKTISEPSSPEIYRDEQSHLYTDEGKYPVIIVALNESGSATGNMIAYVGVNKAPQWPFDIELPSIPLPGRQLTFRIRDDVALFTCTWFFSDQFAERGNGRISSETGKEVTHGFSRSGPHVVTVRCVSEVDSTVKEKDFMIIIGSFNYLPLISYYGSMATNGSQFPPVTPTDAPEPTNTPTATATPVPSATVLVTQTSVPPTATQTATSTLIPTAPAPTATPIGRGGTIPGG